MRAELVELVEYEESVLSDELVAAVPAAFWRELDITLSKAPGDRAWRARPDALSGIARLVQGGLDLTVVIKPKLSGADTIFLAEHAFGQRIDALRRPDADRVGIDSTYSDPVAALLIWYVDAVSDFATRWLRRSYRSRRVTLHGEVRGRFLISQYVAQNLASGRSADVPCIITERTIDTANNRVLKAGLRQVGKLASVLPSSAARRAVRAAVNATLPRFAEVKDVAIGPTQLRAVSTAGPERHYSNLLRATVDLLAGRYLSADAGATATESFLWSMPVLFQEALRGVISEAGVIGLDPRTRPSAHIYDAEGHRLRSSRIDPDYVLETGAGPILLDAKYKDALRLAAPGDDGIVVGHDGPTIRVSRHDVYQMAAYRQHPRWIGAPVALVYPVVLTHGQPLPSPYEVRGFGAPIGLVFMDVGPAARSNVAAFVAQLEQLTSLLRAEVDVPASSLTAP
jgi:5-methylcytosine-specific restriction enzyme subunit McrC